jgi:hypothetical protein
VKYKEAKKKAQRKRRLKAMFDWSDEEYGKAEAVFCDWAIALSDLEDDMKRRNG